MGIKAQEVSSASAAKTVETLMQEKERLRAENGRLAQENLDLRDRMSNLEHMIEVMEMELEAAQRD